MLKDIGFESPDWEDLIHLMLGSVVLASLGAAAWTLWERMRQDPWLALLQTAAARLQKAGLKTQPSSPPRTLAEQMRSQFGLTPANQAIHDWLLRLEAQRYGPSPAQHNSLAGLKRELKQLDWPRQLPRPGTQSAIAAPCAD